VPEDLRDLFLYLTFSVKEAEISSHTLPFSTTKNSFLFYTYITLFYPGSTECRIMCHRRSAACALLYIQPNQKIFRHQISFLIYFFMTL